MRYFRNADAEVLPLTEQRRATRFPREPVSDFAAIWHPKPLARDVEVHDESLGGLGILVTNGDDFVPGMELGIVYAGAMLRCFVVHIQPTDDGRWRVGLNCQRADG